MSTYVERIKEYTQTAKNAHTHAGKMIAFSELLKSVFGVSSYEIVPDIEQYVKTEGLMILKGRMDLRLGQTIMEFKIDLSKELDAGKEEIERYATILRKNGQKISECIITDGVTFKVFVIREKAREVRAVNFEEVTPEQAIMFLDTFLFSGRKVPTADDLNMRFGPGSPIFEEIVGHLTELFKGLKDPIKFTLWSKNMQLVYGSTPPEEAFISQTYLMMLVKLLLARRIMKEGIPPPRESLNGRLFDSQGIHLIEEDFFSWVLSPLFWPQIKPLIDTITEALDYYDLEAVDEDIFKEIYQEIVKRGDRHRIGEYYTPEWLAEMTLREAVATFDPHGKKVHSILDPACGSGTFLTNAISILRENGCSLEEILDNVYGMDLNPLAVAIARTNYLLALGKLIEKRKGPVFIPVYMADSIKLPEVRREYLHKIDVLAIDVEKKTQLNLPLEIALEDSRLKDVLTIYAEILEEYNKKRLNRNQAKKAFESKFKGRESVKEILEKTLETIMNLMDVDKDSVWVFMMRNIYAPLRMEKKKFDLVVGNPPWVSFKYIENIGYKRFIKDTVFDYKLLNGKQIELFTHMDTSTVFYVKAADIYLSDDGIIGFVMPRSVLTGAKQHSAFKKQQKPPMDLVKILDVEKVNPLFNVDACSLIARKGGKTDYPVPVSVYSGELPEKNLRLKRASRLFTLTKSMYVPPASEEEMSPYHGYVLEGASLVPRTLWFVKFVTGTFGLNPDAPLMESLVLPDAKEPWKNMILKGEVEREFVFLTVTGKFVLPFKAEFQPIVLPIKKGDRKFTISTSVSLRRDGKLKMANWLDEAHNVWTSHATKTSIKNFPEPMDRVNYHNLLLSQRQDYRYYTVYTASGTNIAAVTVDKEGIPDIKVGKARISPAGFVADYTTFWFGTNNVKETHYLTAILNSTMLDQMIKKNQPKGKFGPRHICRLPFEFGIPQFDPENGLHKRIAALSMNAIKEAASLSRMSRLKIKAAIPSMKEIDRLVTELLRSA